MFPLKLVSFHSYVGLPEGIVGDASITSLYGNMAGNISDLSMTGSKGKNVHLRGFQLVMELPPARWMVFVRGKSHRSKWMMTGGSPMT